MSDRRLRELERRFAQEQTLEAEVELLRGRLHMGDLTGDWLRVAAALGHPAARKVLGGFVRIPTPEDLVAWVHEWPPEAQLRAVLGVLGSHAELALSPTKAPNLLRDVEPLVRATLNREAPPDSTVQGLLERLREHWPNLPQHWGVPAHGQVAYALVSALAGDGAVTVEFLLKDARRFGSPTPRAAAKLLRAALVPWALRGVGTPPQSLVPDVPLNLEPTPETQLDPRVLAFNARLDAPEFKRQATALRKRRRAKTLSLEHLRLAAWLGDPASWIVAKLEGEPELTADVGTTASKRGARLSIQLSSLLLRFAKKLPRDELRRINYLRRLHDPQAQASEIGPVWPDWSRPLVAAIALAVGDDLLERFSAHDPEDQRPRLALEAAHAFQRDPLNGDPEAVAAAAREASNCARRKLPRRIKAAAQGIGWTAQLVVRIHTSARVPILHYARMDLLQRALVAGIEPQALWDRMRGVGIDWALGRDLPIRATLAYRPQDTYREGDQVEHPVFGDGRVVSVGATRIQVDFEGTSKELVHSA